MDRPPSVLAPALSPPGDLTGSTTWRPARYRRTRVLPRRARHLVQRFTGGWTPSLRAEILAESGIDGWFARQLDPRSLPDRFYRRSRDWWASNTDSAARLAALNAAGTQSIWAANANYQCWSMVRRTHSERQVLETMANFWEHHFHVPALGGVEGLYRADYGRTIRAHALGRFDTLLQRAITHPAMGTFLGNAESTAAAPNENLGRELLELHTVGRDAGYTETDVKNSARILTGYRVDLWNSWSAGYDPGSHWTGPVRVLGFSDPNADPDGRATTRAYLHYLAHHPATARHLARKLAVHFVSDHPSTGLIQYLASVYLASGTAIAPVLTALVHTSEFLDSAGAKTRTAEEELVATFRALGARITAPTDPDSAANVTLWQASRIGLAPFSWPRPDGRPDTADAWGTVARMIGSFSVHHDIAGGWWPARDVRYRHPANWLPQRSIRFDRFVDHLSRRVLGRPSTAAVLHAACQATGVGRYATITRDHDLIRWRMPTLLCVLLDGPAHLTR